MSILSEIGTKVGAELKTIKNDISAIETLDINSIVKQIKVSSRAQVSLSSNTSNAGTITNQIVMTPLDLNSWFKINLETISDDSGASNPNGFGFILRVHTPSTGWTTQYKQGSHAMYVNSLSDWYNNASAFWVLECLNTEVHTFQIDVQMHTTNCDYRFNCTIGNDQRSKGWENQHFEIQEINSTNFSSTYGAR